MAVEGALPPTSSLLYGVQSFLFWLFGGGDGLARLAPALAGAALAVLPWWWRGLLGRWGALVLALVFAVDPWLMIFGRTADGTGLALFLGFLALTAFWQWRESRRTGWSTTAAVASGLLLTAGAQAWSFVPVLVMFWLLFLLPAYRGGDLQVRRGSLVWFGVALLLGATGFGLHLDAAPAVGTSVTEWLGQFDPAASAYVATWPFVRLLVDQPFMLLFGVGGMLALWLAGGTTGAAARRVPDRVGCLGSSCCGCCRGVRPGCFPSLGCRWRWPPPGVWIASPACRWATCRASKSGSSCWPRRSY